jgi:DNA-binding transcriptional LysR family regulator
MNAQASIDFVHLLCIYAHMDWDALRVVLAIARHGTLSRAAEELDAAHTTVGRRLRALEDSLGARLFDATPDGFVLTTAGQEVLEVATRTEEELLALESTMDILFRKYRGAFASFAARHPDVALTLQCTDNEGSLTRREADVALRMSNTPPESLIGRKIGSVDFAVYASAELADKVGRDAEYGAYPWIHWDERLHARWLDAWLSANAPGARIALRVDVSSFVLREVVASGIGVHFLATSEGDSDERLVRIGPIAAAHSRDVWLLTLPELRRNARVRAVMDHMVEATAQALT